MKKEELEKEFKKQEDSIYNLESENRDLNKENKELEKYSKEVTDRELEFLRNIISNMLSKKVKSIDEKGGACYFYQFPLGDDRTHRDRLRGYPY